MDSRSFWALFSQAFDKFLTQDHLFGFFTGIDMFFWAEWGFVGLLAEG